MTAQKAKYKAKRLQADTMTQKALGSAILFTIGIRPAPVSPERTDHTTTPAHTTTPKRLTVVALKWMPNNVIHSSRRGNWSMTPQTDGHKP
jgi:hypothetical protein